ncbi:flagellar hook-length control protein FliK [Alcaligenes sp. SORT26]|uniref:flagellar hook-length control protein FliK n=1 Tax=Alcaligenes sp. SORT26 TaxID=2813780 RepID=UPI001A9E46AE|nr:flagellar hook-length control protein FliK [Alcaligenes sp. SORT26]QTC00101.1 flagellar hook-length control protein FliK [Alcaligenes sp. SORT26]
MTSPILSVLPAAPAAPSAPVTQTAGPAAAPASKDEGFAQHLQTQQQQVQNKGASKTATAKPDSSKAQAPTDSPKQAESVAELAEQASLDALPQHPALLIAAETDLDETLDAQAESGLPAMALSILSQVQAIKNSKTDPKAIRDDSQLPLTKGAAAQTLSSELVSARLQPQTGPLKAVEADTDIDLKAELALPKTIVDASNPLVSTPSRKPIANATQAMNNVMAQAAATQASSSQTRLADEAAASLAAFGRQMAEDARAGVNLSLPALDASLMAQLTASPGAPAPLPSPALLPVGPMTLTVATPVQSPDWGAAMGRQMITLAQQAQGGIQSADIRLDPPELGPLRITLQMQDGMAHAMITSPHAQVRQALEQSLQQLQQQFAENGLTLGQADVGDQNASHQAFHDQLAAKGNQGDQPAFSLNGLAAAEDNSPLVNSSVTRPLAPNALVDTFA